MAASGLGCLIQWKVSMVKYWRLAGYWDTTAHVRDVYTLAQTIAYGPTVVQESIAKVPNQELTKQASSILRETLMVVYT